LIGESYYEEMINSVARKIEAGVELRNGSTLANVFTHDGALKSFTVERIGDSTKFFGYGICQKLTMKLRDKERAIEVVKGQGVDVLFGVDGMYIYACPQFCIDDVKRDENTNELTFVAYDALYKAKTHTVSEISLAAPYTIRAFAEACAAVLKTTVYIPDAYVQEAFARVYENGANFEGTESIREALDDIAEATGTIYYINTEDLSIIFKRLDRDGGPVLHIDKSKYFTLTAKAAHTLQSVTHTTELGDSVTASAATTGDRQYLRDNAFLELRDDVGDIVDEILDYVSGLTITPIECKWRGNFLLECGDKISVDTKDDTAVACFVVDDSFTYNGGLVANIRWRYEENETETDTNPTNLGDALKQTFARVDKANKKIDLVVSETASNSEAISSLQLSTDGIMASVSGIESNVNASIDGVNEDIGTLRKEVEAKATNEAVTIAIRTELANGVSSVKTETGYTFDDAGLHIAKEGEEMQNTLDNTGMYVKRGSEDILSANNNGVEALNVVVKTWLIVGDNSRFENYEGNRTGCFWIGG
jgi:hypothetical protein